MSAPLPIIAKLHEQVGTGHFYDDGYASVGGGVVESRPATEMKRAANRDGSEAAQIIAELYEALEIIGNGDIDVSDTAIIVGNGAQTVFRQVRAALAKARREQS